MNRRTQIVGCWAMVAVCMLVLSHHAVAEVKLGRDGLLRNVHGYELNGTALVPVRGFCEWLGAAVSYFDGHIVITHDGTTLRLRIGEKTAVVNDEVVHIGIPVKAFSGIACVPIRFIAEAFGASVVYDGQIWYPDITIEHEGREAVIIVHQAPPDVVARFVADFESPIRGTYGIDWILTVGRLVHDGEYFESSDIAVWYPEGEPWLTEEDPDYGEPCFLCWAGAIYGQRDGQWHSLYTAQDTIISRQECKKLGIPLEAHRELGFDLYDPLPMTELPGSPPHGPVPKLTPPTVARLTAENTRNWVAIGDYYAVRSLTFKSYSSTWVKVLGELSTPVFKSTSKPVRVELSLIAFDNYDRMLGFGTINLYGIPSEGSTLPFEVTLRDVRVSDIAYARIIPKGAWTYGE